MFNRLKKNLSAILATLLLISLVPATALAFTWQNYITFTVSNNGTGNTNRTAIPILTGIRGQNLIDSALVNSSANNTQVKESSMDRTFGVDTENVTLFVDSILSGQSREYKLYTGYSPQQTRFPIITGYTNNNTAKGFVEVVDDDTNLEIGNNGTISTTGYLNLSPNVGTDLKFTRANSDWVSVPDHANLDFTNGAGTDLPGTGIAWVKLTDATSDGILIKWTVAGNQCNWIFDTDASDRLHFYLSNANGTINIARLSAAITTLENQWIHVAFTYDGLELVTGIKLFINGVRVDATSVTNGVYAGTVDTTAVLCLGAADAGGSAFLSGYMAEAKIYTAELSQSEIIADYRGGHRTTNLEAWWKLAEGTGLPQDSTANVHHATANTADWETGVWNPPHVSIIDKPGALRVYVSGTSNITASTTGGNSTTLDGLSSGNLTIQVNKNSALLGLGTISTVGTGLPIGDNLRFNAPMWSSLLNTSPFTTVDNYGWQGTVVGATWTSQGYSFDGNDEINISALVQGEMQSNFTIIAWLKASTDVTSDRGILTEWATAGWQLLIPQTTRQLAWVMPGSNSLSVDTINDNTWHCVFLVHDDTGNLDTLGWDTVVQDTSVSNGNITPSAVTPHLGSRGASLYFIGAMGEVQIYNSALSLLQLQYNYNATKWKYTGATDNYQYVSANASVPNTSANYTLFTNNAMPYADNLSITIGGTQQLWLEPNTIISSTTIADRAGGNNPGTITWGENPTGITVTVGGITSYESTTSSGIATGIANVVQNYNEPSGWFATGVFAGVLTPELKESFTTAATALGMPVRSLYLMIMFGTAIAVGLSVLIFTGSAIATIGTVIAALAFGSQAGIIDMALVVVVAVLMFTTLYLVKQH